MKKDFSCNQLPEYKSILEVELEKCKHELKTKNEQLEQAQQQLQLAQKQIVAQEKLADLGTRTAEVVHDLKNPPYYISSFADLSVKSIESLVEGIKNPLEYLNEKIVENINKDLLEFAESIAAIKHQAKKGYRIVDSVMVGVHNESFEPELTDINELIALSSEVAYSGFHFKYNKFEINLSIDYDYSTQTIIVNADSLTRVFINLIENGCYAGYSKKKTAGELFQPTVSIKVENLEDSIAINIEDNGQGIPQNVLDKIFTPFFTTKPAGEGTGLGLSIAREIVENHGGKITVKS